jgi:hypothetical protein
MKTLEGALFGRVALHFDHSAAHLPADLSCAARGPNGTLLVAGDERGSLELLHAQGPHAYGGHSSHDLTGPLGLEPDAEVDIEGLAFDAAADALFVAGSHSSKRKKPRGRDEREDLERLAKVKREASRFVLARVPFAEGRPRLGSAREPAVACLPRRGAQSLVELLRTDPHLGPFLRSGGNGLPALPGKDNGFDIEGLACFEDRLLIGLRGPVLRGWAFVLDLEIEVVDQQLSIAPRNGVHYRKHAMDLDGLGIRDLLVHGSDLLVLAGPTMVLDGAHRVFRLHGGPNGQRDSLIAQAPDVLEPIFDIPFLPGCDRAEGLASFSWFDEQDSLLVVYDSPSPARHLDSTTVLADVFALRR